MYLEFANSVKIIVRLYFCVRFVCVRWLYQRTIEIIVDLLFLNNFCKILDEFDIMKLMKIDNHFDSLLSLYSASSILKMVDSLDSEFEYH